MTWADETLESLGYTTAERAYRKSITIHCPNEDEHMLSCRVRIAIIRDQAAKGMRDCSDGTYNILADISRQATNIVFARLPARELTMLCLALSGMMEAARSMERAYRNAFHA